MLNYLKTRKVDPVPALVAVFHPLGPISLTGVLKTFGVSVLSKLASALTDEK